METIKSAEFVMSNTRMEKCPAPTIPEFAFIGRSNVGKSSLINMLVAKKGMAKTSQSPGKTQLINHFLINKSWYLVDLPGYGFAKVSKETRAKWEKMINEYLLKRTNLITVFVLIDSRIPPQEIDLEFIDWLGTNQIPFSIAFTKLDKLKKMEVVNNIGTFKKALSETWAKLPEMFLTSAETKQGREEILSYIKILVDECK